MSPGVGITWRPGTTPRAVFRIAGRWYVYRSDHPLEERMIELTEDYRDEHGDYLPPEPLAWDGVESDPGVQVRRPR